MPHTAIPRRVSRTARRGFLISFTGQVVVLTGWALRWWDDARPHLTLMVWGTFATVSIIMGTTAVLAKCHLTIGQAFQAGVMAGRQAPLPPTVPGAGRGLRAVE